MRLCLTSINTLEQESFLRKFLDLPQVRDIFLDNTFSISTFRHYFPLNANDMQKNSNVLNKQFFETFPVGNDN